MRRTFDSRPRPSACWRGAPVAAALLAALAAGGAQAVSFCIPGPGDQPETGLQGSLSAEAKAVTGGFQGQWCGARKVAQHLLFQRGSFGDVQFKDHCAYASMRDPSVLTALTTGTVVLDARVPTNLVIPADTATPPNPNGKILRSRAMIRAYSALELQGNILVGAYKDLGPVVNGVQTNPLDIYDVSDCLNPIPLSTTYDTAGGNHDGWLTPDGKTYYGIPFSGPRLLSGTAAAPVITPSRIDLHVTDLTDPKNPKHLLNWNRLQIPLAVRGDGTAANSPHPQILATTHFHDVSTNAAGTRVYAALYGGNNSLGGNNNNPSPAHNQRCANGLMILDSSDVANRVPNPTLKFISFLSWCDQQLDPDFGDGSTASAHAVEYVKHENGKEYIVSTEESGGGLNGTAAGMCAHRSYGRMIDITDDANPKVVGTFKPDVNKPENCAANLAAGTDGGMVHYLGFDDRNNMRLAVYAGAVYGIRFVDWRDPTSPKEIAYYKSPNAPTTAAGDSDFTRPDPRYDAENCIYYSGWNQGGIVSLELTDPVYNPCLRRTASGEVRLSGAKVHHSGAEVEFDAKRRQHSGLHGSLRLTDRANKVKIRMNKLETLSGVRDACGGVPAKANSVQFSGSGTFNGAAASFRVCVQDNGKGKKAASPDQFHLTCTAGCSYTASGAVRSGSLKVRQVSEACYLGQRKGRHGDHDDDESCRGGHSERHAEHRGKD